MTITSKADFLFDRDSAGKLIAKELTVKIGDQEKNFTAIPMMRGQLLEISEMVKQGKDVTGFILKQIQEPQFTDEDISVMRNDVALAIAAKIAEISGIKPVKPGDSKLIPSVS